jgi:hypothetical protein
MARILINGDFTISETGELGLKVQYPDGYPNLKIKPGEHRTYNFHYLNVLRTAESLAPTPDREENLRQLDAGIKAMREALSQSTPKERAAFARTLHKPAPPRPV